MNISLPNEIYFESIIGFKPLDKKFHVTKLSSDRHVIKKIDGKSARKRFFDELKIDLSEIDHTHQLFKKSYYYPLGFKKDDIWHSVVIGIIYGDNIVAGSQILENDLTLLSLSMGSIQKNIEKNLKKISKKDISLLFGFACETFS
ncbi:MAG: hypothetical protein V5A68_04940 [Candidatus Thermoplasmatota archaeon]